MGLTLFGEFGGETPGGDKVALAGSVGLIVEVNSLLCERKVAGVWNFVLLVLALLERKDVLAMKTNMCVKARCSVRPEVKCVTQNLLKQIPMYCGV